MNTVPIKLTLSNNRATPIQLTIPQGPTGFTGPRGHTGVGIPFMIFYYAEDFSSIPSSVLIESNLYKHVLLADNELYVYLGADQGNTGTNNAFRLVGTLTPNVYVTIADSTNIYTHEELDPSLNYYQTNINTIYSNLARTDASLVTINSNINTRIDASFTNYYTKAYIDASVNSINTTIASNLASTNSSITAITNYHSYDTGTGKAIVKVRNTSTGNYHTILTTIPETNTSTETYPALNISNPLTTITRANITAPDDSTYISIASPNSSAATSITSGTALGVTAKTGNITINSNTSGTTTSIQAAASNVATFNASAITLYAPTATNNNNINIGTGYILSSSTARIGAGTASPAYTLDVNGIMRSNTRIITPNIVASNSIASNTSGAIIDANGTSNSLVRLTYSSNSTGLALYHDSTNNYLSGETNIPLSFKTNNAVRATISATGNVGIGTTSPQSKLHITDDAVYYNSTNPSDLYICNGLTDVSYSGITFCVPNSQGMAHISLTHATSDESCAIVFDGTNKISFKTDGNERVSINGSGVMATNEIAPTVINLANSSAPGVTTSKLYKSGSSLYFNGVELATANVNNLANYYPKTQIDTSYNAQVAYIDTSLNHYYPKTQIDASYNAQTTYIDTSLNTNYYTQTQTQNLNNLANYYPKTQIDASYNAQTTYIDTSLNHYYPKTQIDISYNAQTIYIDTSLNHYYPKTQIDTSYNAQKSYIDNSLNTYYYTQTQTQNLTNLANYYPKTQIDTSYNAQVAYIDTSLNYYYPKTQIDISYNAQKAYIDNSLNTYYYTQTQTQNLSNLANYYPKTQIDASYNAQVAYIDTSLNHYYPKTQIDISYNAQKSYIDNSLNVNYYTQTQIQNLSNLVNYYPKTQIDTSYNAQVAYIDTSLNHYYPKTQIDTSYNAQVAYIDTSLNHYYPKTQIDTSYNAQVSYIDTSLNHYYPKTQIDTSYNAQVAYIDTSLNHYYPKTQIDTSYNAQKAYIDTSLNTNYYTQTQTQGLSNLANYYPKTQIDTSYNAQVAYIDTSLNYYYPKTQIDTSYNAQKAYIDNSLNTYYYTQTQTQGLSNLTNYYLKTRIDASFELLTSNSPARLGAYTNTVGAFYGYNSTGDFISVGNAGGANPSSATDVDTGFRLRYGTTDGLLYLNRHISSTTGVPIMVANRNNASVAFASSLTSTTALTNASVFVIGSLSGSGGPGYNQHLSTSWGGWGTDISNSVIISHPTGVGSSTIGYANAKPLLTLTRGGNSGEAYASGASFDVGRYTNTDSDSYSSLYVSLFNSTCTSRTKTLTLQSNGYIGVNKFDDLSYNMDVSGNARIGTMVYGSLFSAAPTIYAQCDTQDIGSVGTKFSYSHERFTGSNGSTAGEIYNVYADGSSNFQWRVSNVQKMRLTNQGYLGVGLGNTFPSYMLDVNGTARISGEMWANSLAHFPADLSGRYMTLGNRVSGVATFIGNNGGGGGDVVSVGNANGGGVPSSPSTIFNGFKLRYSTNGNFECIKCASSDSIELLGFRVYRGTDCFQLGSGTGLISDEQICPLVVTTSTARNLADLSGNSSAIVSYQGNGSAGYTTGTFANYSGSYSMYAVGDIICRNHVAFSDNRIKRDVVDVSDGYALSHLRDLEPKTYNYVDQVRNTSRTVFGFIAQQVAEVLPYAVNERTDYIPNILRICDVATVDGITTVSDVSGIEYVFDASSCGVMKLIAENWEEKTITRASILSPSSFTIVETSIEDGVYVLYGDLVSNFNVLDKTALFTVGISAMQEIDRQQQADKVRISALEAQVADLTARLQTLESLLNA